MKRLFSKVKYLKSITKLYVYYLINFQEFVWGLVLLVF